MATLTSDLANLQGSVAKLLELISTVLTYVEKVRVSLLQTYFYLLIERVIYIIHNILKKRGMNKRKKTKMYILF